MGAPRGTLAERFWAKVNKDGPTQPHMATPCWLWTAYEDRQGYGQIMVRGRGPIRTHRIAWELENGTEFPAGKMACHACDCRLCVRADHIFVGDAFTNSMDMRRKDRGAHWRVLSAKDVVSIRDRFRAGESNADLAREFGVSAGSMNAAIRGRKWAHVPGAVAFAEVPNLARRGRSPLLTVELVAAARARCMAGEKSTAIAREFGVDRSVLQRALRGAIKAFSLSPTTPEAA